MSDHDAEPRHDARIGDLGPADLAHAVGGAQSSFTGQLLQLIAKADLDNRARLGAGFPAATLAFRVWQELPGDTTWAAYCDWLDTALAARQP